MTSTERRPLRRDAARNREKLLAAAHEVFAEHGVGAPLEEIARRAGVSIGTLYNRFPTRESLLDAVFPQLIDAQRRAGEEALTDPDPWRGFVTYVERTCELQASNRALSDLLSMRIPAAQEVAQACGAGLEQLAVIIARARDAGMLRADFSPQDLVVIVWANARIVEATAGVAPDAWRRHLAFLLHGLRARDDMPPSPRGPLTEGEVYEAMVRLGGGR